MRTQSELRREAGIPESRGTTAGVELAHLACRYSTVPTAQDVSHGTDKTGSQPAVASCRVCLEEDTVANFCQPCCCTGSMSHAHPTCIQNWINEKGDMLCEICKQPYKGNFEQPPPQPAATPGGQAGRVLVMSGDPEAGGSGIHQDEDFDDRLTPIYGVAAIMIFTLLLFVHHIVDTFAGTPYQQGGRADAPARADFTDGGVTFSWGSLNASQRDKTVEPWEANLPSNASGNGVGFQSEDEESLSFEVFLAWLFVRFALILIPALLAYRLLVLLRMAEERREAERGLSNELWNMEAGISAAQPSLASSSHLALESGSREQVGAHATRGDGATSLGGEPLHGRSHSAENLAAGRLASVSRHSNSV